MSDSPEMAARIQELEIKAMEQQRLETTSQSIDEVADAVGLRTSATLRLHFRRTLRTTPTAYRRRFSRVSA